MSWSASGTPNSPESDTWPRRGRPLTTAAPIVSILLPAFNARATLPACLRSIARQTMTSWECVAVDDGSEDATLAFLHAVAQRDARFVVLSTTHRGLLSALNTGLSRCRGQFVARMDADDLMHRQRLEAQCRAL